MRDRVAEFGGATVAVVTFTPVDRLAAYREHLALPPEMMLLTDPERRLYRALGAERAGRRQVWSPGTLRMYGSLMRKGRRLQRATEDIRQLGADAVVDADGVLHCLALPQTPDARPSVDELLTALP